MQSAGRISRSAIMDLLQETRSRATVELSEHVHRSFRVPTLRYQITFIDYESFSSASRRIWESIFLLLWYASTISETVPTHLTRFIFVYSKHYIRTIFLQLWHSCDLWAALNMSLQTQLRFTRRKSARFTVRTLSQTLLLMNNQFEVLNYLHPGFPLLGITWAYVGMRSGHGKLFWVPFLLCQWSLSFLPPIHMKIGAY